jgi:hypothetical protein
MTRDLTRRHARVLGLVQAAARLADPHDPLGVEVRRELVRTTGLSPANVDLCLRSHLEHHASPGDIARLVACSTPVPSVHLLLSANVFVAALRALALALAASTQVRVRASTREPAFVRALLAAVHDPAIVAAVDLVDDLSPASGDEIHLYGRNETIASICARMPDGVRVRVHGTGMGIALVAQDVDLDRAASAIAADVVPFDQRGCLSPRVVYAHGPPQRARALAARLAGALASWDARVPLGRLDGDELADVARYRDTLAVVGDCFPAGSGVVGLLFDDTCVLVSPVGRNLHVVATGDGGGAASTIRALAPHVAAVGISPGSRDPWIGQMIGALPHARRSPLGSMQRPAFDGPVDLRFPAALTPSEVVARLR